MTMTKKQLEEYRRRRQERKEALEELKELDKLSREARYHSRKFDEEIESIFRILRG